MTDKQKLNDIASLLGVRCMPPERSIEPGKAAAESAGERDQSAKDNIAGKPVRFSFCIITKGLRTRQIENEVRSIRALALSDYEILIGGRPPELPGRDIKTFFLPEPADNGRPGELRKHLMERASGDVIVVADDDVIFQDNFARGILKYGLNFDALAVRFLNKDGTRCWDWATTGGPNGQYLLSYDEDDPNVYLTGGVFVVRSHVLKSLRWNDEQGFYKGEDVAFSRSLQDAGFSIKFCGYSTAVHDDDRYTEVCDYTTRLHSRYEFYPLQAGLEGKGIYYYEDSYHRVSPHGEIRVPTALLGNALQVSFLLGCDYAGDYTRFPFETEVWFNGEVMRALTFEQDCQKHRVSVTLPASGRDGIITIISDTAYVPILTVNPRDRRILALKISEIEVRKAADELIGVPSTDGPSRLKGLSENRTAEVYWYSRLFDDSLDAAFSRTALSALENVPIKTNPETAMASFEYCIRTKTDREHSRFYRTLLARSISRGLFISLAPLASEATRFFPLQNGKRDEFSKNIAYTWTDYRKVLPADIQSLNSMDEVWVPNEYSRKILVQEGVRSTSLKLAPAWVDPAVYAVAPDVIEGRSRNPNKLIVCAASGKGIVSVYPAVQSFLEAFGGVPDVHLAIIMDCAPERMAQFLEELHAHVRSMSPGRDVTENIRLLTMRIPEGDMARLLSFASAYIALGGCSGWTVPLLRPIMLQVPVVATAAGAVLDLLGPQSAFLINPASLKPEERGIEGFEELVPARHELTAALREILSKPEEARRRAQAARMLLTPENDRSNFVRVIKESLAEVHARATRRSTRIIELPDCEAGNPQRAPAIASRTDRAITVGFDGRMLAYSESADRGIGHYTINHLLQVASIRPQWRFICYLDYPDATPEMKKLLDLSNVEVAIYDEKDQKNLDLFHIPDQVSPLFGFDSPLRIAPRVPTTITFYDLTPLVLKDLFFDKWYPRVQRAYFSRIKQIMNSDCHVLAISNHTRADLITHLGIAENRISVIMAGLNSAQSTQPGLADIDAVRAKFGISRPFFLTVGALDPHKNFNATLEAFSRIRGQGDYQLVVAGSEDDPNKPFYKERIAKAGLQGVIFTGFIPRLELEALYASAAALVFPSLYEGFGFPVLEAMARSCPVITVGASSIPEVAGDAALLVSPGDISGISEAMLRLVGDRSLRDELIRRGMLQVGKFSWDKTARLTLQAWEKMLDCVKLDSPAMAYDRAELRSLQ